MHTPLHPAVLVGMFFLASFSNDHFINFPGNDQRLFTHHKTHFECTFTNTDHPINFPTNRLANHRAAARFAVDLSR
jgi:hypothetical protein